MSYLLCFSQKKNLKLSENELEIPFNLKLYRFNFKQIKSIAHKLQPDLKKKVKSVQSQIEKVLNQSEKTVFWMRLIQKFNILLFICMIFGIYYMTLEGEDKEQTTFQAGVYILAAISLAIILLQILCIFLWHYSFSQITHEISLILLSETQRSGNQITWRLSTDYSTIIFGYQAAALMTNSQINQNNEASVKSMFQQQSQDNFNKKYPPASRFMKDKKQVSEQKVNIYSPQEEEKVMVKNIGVITDGNDQEIISAAKFHEDLNGENDKYSDGQQNNLDQYAINLRSINQSQKEITIKDGQVIIEMGEINHTKQPSNSSYQNRLSSNNGNKSKKLSKVPTGSKEEEEVIKFNTDNDEDDEENFQQELCSEKQSEEKHVLNQANIVDLNKTNQLSNQKLVPALPLGLEIQNINSNHLIIFNQSSINQTEQDFTPANHFKNQNSDSQSPSSIQRNSSDDNVKETKYKQSNFRTYINNGDENIDPEEDESDEENQDYSNIQNKRLQVLKSESRLQDSPIYTNNLTPSPFVNNIINQNFNFTPVKEEDQLSLDSKKECLNKVTSNRSEIQLDQENHQLSLLSK